MNGMPPKWDEAMQAKFDASPFLMTPEQHRRAAELLQKDHPEETPEERAHARMLARHHLVAANLIERRLRAEC